METLIPVINKLQDIFKTVGSDSIQLPQLVVLGSQSSGKSSVLESLVGRSFLPRGTGIVTRRPLILQLIQLQDDEAKADEYGEFSHIKDRTYTDFNDIREEIEHETDRMAGDNKGISADPIILKIYSPKVVDLTLVDLPGITKVPVGDQPANIEDQIIELIYKYIENPHSIILAVSAANMDIATSESLKIAKDVDPDGLRTLCVITKLDLMDAGTDAIDVLSGQVIPVKLGIIGVVNRSQKDIVEKKSISDQLKDESTFLLNHYPTLAAKNGVPYLAETLNRLLMHHIQDCLPDLRNRVNMMTAQFQSLLDSYGEEITNKTKMLLQIITKFASAYCNTIEGSTWNIETPESNSGAKISRIVHEDFEKTLNAIDPLKGLSKNDILMAMKDSDGFPPTLFFPDRVFHILTKRQICFIERPSLQCVNSVYEEMLRIIQICVKEIHQEMQRFPKLHEKIVSVSTKFLRMRLKLTKTMVQDLMQMELSCINSKHPEFDKSKLLISGLLKSDEKISGNPISQTIIMNSANNIKPSMTPIDPFPDYSTNSSPPESKDKFGEVMERMIESYFNIVRTKMQDSVLKVIAHYMIIFVKENLQSELTALVAMDGDAKDLLEESYQMKGKREDARKMLQVLERASNIISDLMAGLNPSET